MSNDFYAKAIRDHPSHAFHVMPTDQENKYVDVVHGRTKMKKLQSHRVVSQNRKLLNVQPATTVPAALLSNYLWFIGNF